MRTGLKLLTVGLVLVTAAVAGCSSTTAGPAGAIQDEVELAATSPASPTSSASSSSSSDGPTSSPDPVVSPTAAPTEAPASPVASPTGAPSPTDSPDDPVLLGSTAGNNDVCDSGLAYKCGDIGQSGVGIVFYASATPFLCVANGVDRTSLCNYLEVAPQGWNGTLVKCKDGCEGSPDSTSDWGSAGVSTTGKGYAYCNGSGKKRVIPNASGTLIGTGYPNTSAMLTMCKSDDAGGQVRGYKGGGMTDWSLPSQDELIALFYYTGRNAIGGFDAGFYWSSSQSNEEEAWVQSFAIGSNYGNAPKTRERGVRAVRAF